ncbi:MAG: hypothetical protein VB877_00500 [Pirellulaceae bacterium]
MEHAPGRGSVLGVSWEYTDDTNRHPLALEQAELAELMTAWPLLSPDPSDPI